MSNVLNKLSEKFSSPIDFINDSEVKNIIEDYKKKRFKSDNYKEVIEAMINTMEIKNKEVLIDLFASPSILTISSYKKFLRYLGQEEWDIYRNKHEKIYDNLSIRICTNLEHQSLEKTVDKFSYEIDLIEDVIGKSRESIISLFKSYQDSFNNRDILRQSSATSNIKNLIKEFNSKSREKFVIDYINNNINQIKDNFKCGINKNNYSTNKIDINQFLNIVFNDDKLRNIFRIFIEDKFNYTVDNSELGEVISNILKGNDEDNFRFFNISESSYIQYLESTKAFNRLNKNYLSKIKDYFSISQIDEINRFLTTLDNYERQNLKAKFTKRQLLLLEQIKPILQKAHASVCVNDNEFSFYSDTVILDQYLESEAKESLKRKNDYIGLCNLIRSSYYAQCRALSKFVNTSSVVVDISDIPFTDDNYVLTNTDYLLNFQVLANILVDLDMEVIDKYFIEDNNYKSLKKLLIDDGLLSSILIYGEKSEIVTNIINNMKFINKGNLYNNFNINRLKDIVRKAELFKFINDFTLSLLGEDVAEKIVYNFQFLQGDNTYDKIELRLRKAHDLMIRAESINKSAVPYFEPVRYSDVSLERYNNNDPEILTSGIDSNTCFKISANDNDYLFYSILNKNGMVARIKENDKMIGRITAHRLSNVLLINSVRSIDNNYRATSFEELERNDKMVEVVSRFAKKMIDITTNTDCPIDFVVSNKAGILGAPEYNDKFLLVSDYLFKNPIDCYSEDFLEFKNMYNDSSEQFLQQVPYCDNYFESPFTTDYGNYPIVLIAARENKLLNRRFDITVKSPDAIYERPKSNVCRGCELNDYQIRKLERIDSLNFINDGGKCEDFIRCDYLNCKIKAFEIGDDYYILVDENDNIIYKSIGGKSSVYENSKVLVRCEE